MINAFICCEFSGIVRDSFIRAGHNALSVDILPTESLRGPHLQRDIKALGYEFISKFDLMIAHPPCQYLTVAGNRAFKENPERLKKTLEALEFVKWLWDSPAPYIAIENPKGRLSGLWRPPSQYIEPYQFGNPERKKTGLWLKGLPPLVPSQVIEPELITTADGRRYSKRTYRLSKLTKSRRSRARARFFPEVAEAMADQWAPLIESKKSLGG